jgi:hypothetical protein
MNIEQVVKELQSRLSYDSKEGKPKEGSGRRNLAPIDAIKCADGTTLSVQASSCHHCTPRDDDGPYTAVEVGFPSMTIESFLSYIENADLDPIDSVYGWVPIYVVAQAILDHGGFAEKF